MRKNKTRTMITALATAGLGIGLLAAPAAAADPKGADVVHWPADGKGQVDTVTVDFDVDGVPEEIEWDRDGDGVYDQLTIYKDGKVVKTYTAKKGGGEFYDKVYVTDADGGVTVHTDVDGDGEFDESKPATGTAVMKRS